MSSKQEIKDLFSSELLNTSEYQIVLKIKELILKEISTPKIQKYINYTFEEPLTHDSIKVLQMCIKLEFGFLETNISENSVGIDMDKFLD